jgi:hypothetical protein
MVLSGQQMCFVITIVGAVVATLVYVYLIKPNMSAGYSPSESNCINQSVRKCRNAGNVMDRTKCMRSARKKCMQSESYTTTDMIKTMMINKMPHGLATSDNRSMYKENCCGL